MNKLFLISLTLLVANSALVAQQVRPRLAKTDATSTEQSQPTARFTEFSQAPKTKLSDQQPQRYYPSSDIERDSHVGAFVRRTAYVSMTVSYPNTGASANAEPVKAISVQSTAPAIRTAASALTRLNAGWKSSRLRGMSTGNVVVDRYLVESSERYRIDPLLIYSQMHQESGFKPQAISHKGARGLMQLMPATARRMGVADINDPQQNIEGGVKYMRLLLDMFAGDLKLALAGYNAGEGAVVRYGYQIPPYRETQDYVRRISARYRAIARPQATPELTVE
jgi:soluble lytic murein transglycosylase-like protein